MKLGSHKTKQKRASDSRQGTLAACGEAVRAGADARSIFRDIERIRRTVNNAGRFSSKALISEGRF